MGIMKRKKRSVSHPCQRHGQKASSSGIFKTPTKCFVYLFVCFKFGMRTLFQRASPVLIDDIVYLIDPRAHQSCQIKLVRQKLWETCGSSSNQSQITSVNCSLIVQICKKCCVNLQIYGLLWLLPPAFQINGYLDGNPMKTSSFEIQQLPIYINCHFCPWNPPQPL